jgi:glutathione-specific gamma-glutamylcyclotransferase
MATASASPWPSTSGSDGTLSAPEGVWIFAYGSLMWRPGFAYAEAAPARLHGYHRSLCIYSIVHRGTPEQPGLVLGLDRGGSCRGWAFRVDAGQEAETLAYLDARELVTDVYKRKRLPVTVAGQRLSAWGYVVRREHPQYAGQLAPERLLDLVRRSAGRSGHCRDYLLGTVAHLEAMGIVDGPLHALAKALAAD